MKISEIYKWLLETDPIKDNVEIRLVWSNMASYCYFVNTLDFDSVYKDKLIKVLEKSKKYKITVPDDNHQNVLHIANEMGTTRGDQHLKVMMYG